MAWKQPITSEVLKLDTITRLVFMEIIMRTRRDDMPYPETFWHGNRNHSILLKKGQSIFAVDRFANETGISKKLIKRSLDFLSKTNNLSKWEITRKSFGLIITVQNYDELVSLENQWEINSKSMGNQKQINGTTSKKIVEIDKIDKIVEGGETEKILTFLKNEYPKIVMSNNFNKILQAILSKPIEDQELYIGYVVKNKGGMDKNGYDKLASYLGWQDWYWQDYLLEKKERDGWEQTKARIEEENRQLGIKLGFIQ